MKHAQKMTPKHLGLGQILDNTGLITSLPCIYFLLNGQDQVIYVGQTKRLSVQLRNHQLAGQQFARFTYSPCAEWDLDRLEQEAIARHRPVLNKRPVSYSTSSYLSKQLICLKHNITPVAFERLREIFGLESVHCFGNTKYYKPEDVDNWLKCFKGLVVRGRHVLQTSPTYLAVGISSRTKQIQLYTER